MNDKDLAKLKAYVEIDPTKKTNQQSIADLCKAIQNVEIALPIYQRDVSWKLQKMVDLFNYQLYGKAAVSPISLNDVSSNRNPEVLISFLNREELAYDQVSQVKYSVIDGQQRLTTNYKAYTNSPDLDNVVLDIKKGKFIIIDEPEKKYQIKVGKLYNQRDQEIYDELARKNFEDPVKMVLFKVRAKFSSYKYTINIAENLNIEEQINWFEVLNNAGSKISDLELTLSKSKLHFDIYSLFFKPYVNKIIESNKQFEERLFKIHSTRESYPLVALNPSLEIILEKKHKNNYAPVASDKKPDIVSRLSSEQMTKCIELTNEALDKTLKFIKLNNLDDKVTRIEYINYLIGFFVNNPIELNDTDNLKLKDWFCKINFANMTNPERREAYQELLILLKVNS